MNDQYEYRYGLVGDITPKAFENNVLQNFSRSWYSYARNNGVVQEENSTIDISTQAYKKWYNTLCEEVCTVASEYLD